MPFTYKILGQSAPAATTLTDLYTVSAATECIGSSIVVCNRSSLTSFRVSVAPAGAADDPKHYLFYDTTIAANDTKPFTLGITLAASDVVRVYNTLATVSFTLFGTEIT